MKLQNATNLRHLIFEDCFIGESIVIKAFFPPIEVQSINLLYVRRRVARRILTPYNFLLFWKNILFLLVLTPKTRKWRPMAAISLTNNSGVAAETEAKAALPDQYPSEFPSPISSPDGGEAGYEKSCHDSAATYPASEHPPRECQADAVSHLVNIPHTVLCEVSCVCSEPFQGPFM